MQSTGTQIFFNDKSKKLFLINVGTEWSSFSLWDALTFFSEVRQDVYECLKNISLDPLNSIDDYLDVIKIAWQLKHVNES